ncbi:MAG: VWA domain-containing protein, partial [Planctomycetaceae bacterium]|nr:VWA domain-containing protein [Planctomycetaceae bacterium]
MSASLRRLPIYLVLDCSESMAGEAIQEMSRGVDTMIDTLLSDPLALETAYISVITFSSYAKQVVPLTELMEFQRPPLSVRTGTALGSALQTVEVCIEREVRRTTATQKGDYKPLVILITDGDPTDDWEDAAR